jgi:hypothetical protein
MAVCPVSSAAEKEDAAPLQPGDKVVTIGPASVMDGPKLMGTLAAGTELQVRKVRDSWVGIPFEKDGETKTLWVQRKDLRLATANVGKPEEKGQQGPATKEKDVSPKEPAKPDTPTPPAPPVKGTEKAELCPYVMAKVQEARKSLKAKPHFDAEVASALTQYVIKAAPDLGRDLPGLRALTPPQWLSAKLEAGRLFLRADMVYPASGGLNKKATVKAFESCVRNITGEKMKQIERTVKWGNDSDSHLKAFVLLANAAGLFVPKPDTFSAQAFDAALGNLTEDKVDKTQGFFTDRTEACYCLLRAAGRFVTKEGSFDKDRYNAALGSVTAERVAAIKGITKLPKASSAVDVILMNASLAAQAE